MNIRGIDVSSYHGKIDWEKVKADGIQFVIIRAGWGKVDTDPKFEQNIKDALKIGLKVGVYWYIYAKRKRDIIVNAEKCDSVIAPFKKSIKMKVWACWQEDSDKYKGRTTKAERTELVKLFCEEMTNKGYNVGIYSSTDYMNKKFTDVNDYPLWLGYYATTFSGYNPEIWQYTTVGNVDGITKKVDINYLYDGETKSMTPLPTPKTYPQLKRGMCSIYVKTLQTKLFELGYYKEKYTTTFEQSTLSAVVAFQKDSNLVVDGVVGPETWKALYN